MLPTVFIRAFLPPNMPRSAVWLAAALLMLPLASSVSLPTLPAGAVTCEVVGGTPVDDCAVGGWSAQEDHGRKEYGETIGVSPDGSMVFVAGYTHHQVTTSRSWINWTVSAYEAETGSLAWSTMWDGPGALGSAPFGDFDFPTDLVVAPDGATVFVTGYSYVSDARKDDFATIAFSAASGTVVWEAFYHGNGDPTLSDQAYAIDVTPDGSTVVVAGKSYGPKLSTGFTTSYDWATIAYDAATGAEIWVTRQAYLDNNAVDSPVDVEVSADGSFVAVGGESDSLAVAGVQFTAAVYEISTGAQRWLATYNGESTRADRIAAIAISPASNAVFVTGYSQSSVSLDDYATIRYNAATGAQEWVHRFTGVGGGSDTRRAGDDAEDIVVSPDGATVYVTGTSPGQRDANNRSTVDFVTIALDAATGTLEWEADLEDAAAPAVKREAREMAITSDGGTLVVTGRSYAGLGGTNFTTVAYDAATGSESWRVNERGDNATAWSMGARDLVIAPDDARVFVAGSLINNATAEDIGIAAYAVDVPASALFASLGLP